MEWRTFDDDSNVSMTPDQIIEKADSLKALAKKLNLEMPSLGAYITGDNLEEVEKTFKAANAIGARNIRIGPGGYGNGRTYNEIFKEARKTYEKVAELAEQYDVRAVVETHMGQICPSIAKAVNFLKGLNPKHVGIMWDPGNQVLEGKEVPKMAIEIAGEYLAEVHVKNMWYLPEDRIDGQLIWKCVVCPVDKGIANWPEILKCLKDVGYDGWLFFEDFSKDLPLYDKLKYDIDWFKSLLEKI
jgi:sugar phosphate isomerase/epimerase